MTIDWLVDWVRTNKRIHKRDNRTVTRITIGSDMDEQTIASIPRSDRSIYGALDTLTTMDGVEILGVPIRVVPQPNVMGVTVR